MSSILNPQEGYTQTGIGSPLQSQTIIGRDKFLQWEAVAFGPQGRPDYTEGIRFNLTLISGQANNAYLKMGSISFSANDISAIIDNADTLIAPVALQLVEVMVCNNGQSGRMIILGSPVYT